MFGMKGNIFKKLIIKNDLNKKEISPRMPEKH